MSTLQQVKAELRTFVNAQRAEVSLRFFKTGRGQYGEGDQFLGLKVPDIRKVAGKYVNLDFPDIHTLLTSPFHEERFLALAILTKRFAKSDSKEREKIYHFYMDHTDSINNWDLVDVSAPRIVGEYLYPLGSRFWSVLPEMAKEDHLWRNRIAIMATFAFIRNKTFTPTFEIAEILLNHEHDLIHKAVGWMLREVANRELAPVEKFLRKHCKTMPRTMLRYTIEKFPEELRLDYLKNICR